MRNMNPYKIIKHPISTEKAVRLMEAENKLMFAVDKNADKAEVKQAVEALFKVKVTSVNTVHTVKGEKRAYVKIEGKASDVATQLGLM